MCLVTQLYLTLFDRMDCGPPGSSVHGDSPGKNTGVGCHALFQGIFPTQGLNPGLPHCRRILYQLSHQGSPRILKWVPYPFSSGSSWPRNRSRGSYIAGRFFTSWAPGEVLSAFIACPSCTFWCHYKVEHRPEIGSVISVPLILFKKHKTYTTWKTAVRKHKANSLKVRSV